MSSLIGRFAGWSIADALHDLDTRLKKIEPGWDEHRPFNFRNADDALYWLIHGIKSHATSTNRAEWEDVFACHECRNRFELYRSFVQGHHR